MGAIYICCFLVYVAVIKERTCYRIINIKIMIYYTDFYIPSIKRTFLIAKNEKGVCNLSFDNNEKRFVSSLTKYLNDDIKKSPAKLKTEIKQVLEYFAGKRKSFDMKVFLKGTSFMTSAWVALSKVQYGKTISYSELAEKAGNKKAIRAAATSCAKNPLPIIIPCHRVIAKNGSLGGFGGGIELKKKMLKLEKVI